MSVNPGECRTDVFALCGKKIDDLLQLKTEMNFKRYIGTAPAVRIKLSSMRQKGMDGFVQEQRCCLAKNKILRAYVKRFEDMNM